MKLFLMSLLGYAGVKNYQYYLGRYYMLQKDDPLKALYWFKKAYKNRHKSAAKMIASLYFSPLHNEEQHCLWKEKAEQQKRLK